jgi:N-acetylneuraminate synthase
MITLSNGRKIGPKHPCYIVAEIGINHNGSLELALRMIDEAHAAGCDAVKFQKRTPELCVPPAQQSQERDTPWGRITYLEYRHKVEFGMKEFSEINRYCQSVGIDWFASCWDIPSVDFMEQFRPPLYKAASATLTDHALLLKMKNTGKPLILSTGMSDSGQIFSAVNTIGTDNLLIAHTTSAYPCPLRELNLSMLHTLRNYFPDALIGYSGHETGLATTVAAVAMGACFIERHFTLDRAMWGSDQAASVEPTGMRRLVKDIRAVEEALGDGVKRVYASELDALKKLRLNLAGLPASQAVC